MARSAALALVRPPRVNLMPRVELERREASALVRRWLVAVCAAVVILAVVCAGTFALRWAAEQRVALAEARTASLLGELASLADVSQAVRTVSALETFRADAMAADMDWSPLVGRFAAVLPAGVTIGGFDLSTGGAPAGDPSEGIGLTGTLTLSSDTPLEMAPVIRSLRGLAGVHFLDGREVTSEPGSGAASESGIYDYVITLDIDQTAYSGDFARQEQE